VRSICGGWSNLERSVTWLDSAVLGLAGDAVDMAVNLVCL